ncbi:MAG: membrane protein insertase YidC [Candidatus Aureabacteria bacterium]|nr:membrane protein insertase YidC [Candidatus Auribacterota bacterium]
MDRNTILAIVISLAIILVYTRFITPVPKKLPDKEIPVPEQAENQETTTSPNPKQAQDEGVIEVKKSLPSGKLSTSKTDTMDVAFSDKGGCIAEVTLRRSGVIKKGPIQLVCPLSVGMQPIATSILGSVTVDYDSPYELVPGKSEGREISFRHQFGALSVTKSYYLSAQGFVIKSNIELMNSGSDQISIPGGVEICGGVVEALTQGEKDSFIGIDALSEDGKVQRIAATKLSKPKSFNRKLRWLCIRNQFFASVLKSSSGIAGYSARKIKIENGLDGVQAAIRTEGIMLKPAQKMVIPLEIYIGPKEYSALEAFGAAGVIDFGWFGFLGKWILYALNALYRLCGNYGVAIILLTVIIRLILYPLNQKSFRSMKEMQKLQPKIAVLQEKYKGDAKKKQEEMMKIYREHGVNPAGGCLPLLLQFPILIAFFRVLQNAVELWGAPFILWIKDLSEPDALMKVATGNVTVPLIGKIIEGKSVIFINVLPILMLVVFFIQQKMTPASGMAASREQEQQQKLMSYVMPFMFGIIFYNMPSGLNLYFAVSTLLGILQQKYMIR